MIIPTNRNQTVDFISPLDENSAVKTVFKIGYLTSREYQAIQSEILKFAGDPGLALHLVRDIVRLALRGWTDCLDENGAPVIFVTEKKSILGLPEKDVVSESLLDQIHNDYQLQIARKIQEISGLLKTEQGSALEKK